MHIHMLHYTTAHYSTVQYVTVQYTTLHMHTRAGIYANTMHTTYLQLYKILVRQTHQDSPH